LADRAQIIAEHEQRKKERAARKTAEPKFYDLTVAQAGKPGLPPPGKQTNDVSGVDGDLNSLAETAANGRDELVEAVSAETEHAEAARLQEAKDILKDYISLLKDRTNKPATPLLAQ
jgi:hypothetical protein